MLPKKASEIKRSTLICQSALTWHLQTVKNLTVEFVAEENYLVSRSFTNENDRKTLKTLHVSSLTTPTRIIPGVISSAMYYYCNTRSHYNCGSSAWGVNLTASPVLEHGSAIQLRKMFANALILAMISDRYRYIKAWYSCMDDSMRDPMNRGLRVQASLSTHT